MEIPNDDEQVVKYWYKQGLRSSKLNLDFLQKKNKVICFGAGPSLESYAELLPEIKQANVAICSADGATRWLVEQEIYPDFVVTDLDGITPTMIDNLLEHGVSMQVLTHGDNYEKVQNLRQTLSDEKISLLSFSTQGRPMLAWDNTLGFTDGDRLLCALISQELPIFCAGYDLNAEKIGKYSKPYFTKNMPLTDKKRIKLNIAHQIMEWVDFHFEFYRPLENNIPGIASSAKQFLSM